MCSHYQAVKDTERMRQFFNVEVPSGTRADLWPGYMGSFIRRHPHADVGDEAVAEFEAVAGVFGMVPHWSKDSKISKHTYNARSETVAEKPSFREAWKRSQHCVIPAEAIYEPDWRSGKAVATRIASKKGEPFGLAGLWSVWRSPQGDVVHSYTMLTINADDHPLMRQFHKPLEEKRMVVILPQSRQQGWLSAKSHESMDFLLPFPADQLEANPASSAF